MGVMGERVPLGDVRRPLVTAIQMFHHIVRSETSTLYNMQGKLVALAPGIKNRYKTLRIKVHTNDKSGIT